MHCHSYFSDPTSYVLVCFLIFYYQLYSVRMPPKKRAAPKTSTASANFHTSQETTSLHIELCFRERSNPCWRNLFDPRHSFVGRFRHFSDRICRGISSHQDCLFARKYSCSSLQSSSFTHFACVSPGFPWRY